MTTRADVNRLADTNRRIVELAKADLLDLMGAMDLSTPEAVRDALLEIVPEMVREYGDVAAAAAAEWYSDLRAASGIPGRHVTALSDGADLDAVAGSVRSLAGGLWGDDPLGVASALGAALQRYITYSSRDTVRRNAAKDPQRARYARVPTGEVTCAFCEMTASRGFVYHSKQLAGDGNDYHDDCNCQVVVEWDAAPAHIQGYDPDAMYSRYQAARNSANSGDPNEIAAAMRRLYPDQYTDGVKP